VLKALVGDVVIEKQLVEGYEQPQMVARLTINAIPALAVLALRSIEPHAISCSIMPVSPDRKSGSVREPDRPKQESSVPRRGQV